MPCRAVGECRERLYPSAITRAMRAIAATHTALL